MIFLIILNSNFRTDHVEWRSLMDWDDEFENGYNDMDNTSQRDGSMSGTGDSDGGLGLTDISDPTTAYLLLSGDARDEITGTTRKRMKCNSCGHRFTGEFYESCPKCSSLDTEEILPFMDGEEKRTENANMKCLSCGHTFVGEVWDSCPECYSPNTEEIISWY